jgi:ParB-like chromosome segregation protein Spo0J
VKAQRPRRQPASRVEDRLLTKIIPYDRNPRTHSPEQISLLANLMRKYGVDQPIVVDEKGVILKGHGRRLAAIRAGLISYPVVVQRGLKENDKRALRIADNQVALLSGWDDELIKMEVGELKLGGFEMPLLGFSDAQMTRLSDNDQDASPQLSNLSFAVIVRCKNEDDQRDLLKRFEREGLKCEALIS